MNPLRHRDFLATALYLFITAAVILAVFLLSGCSLFRVSTPTPIPPTITQAPATHIPSLTATRYPTKTDTPIWTLTPTTQAPTSTDEPTHTVLPSTLTPTRELSATPNMLPTASRTPTLPTIPAGRNTPILGTQTPVPQLPSTGGTFDPAECKTGYALGVFSVGQDIYWIWDCQDDEKLGARD